jgi:pimeloyl-ACP methyl ester carboxylesterase
MNFQRLKSLQARRIVARLALYYLAICVVLGVCLGEMAFRVPRRAVADRPVFASTAARFGAALQDVSVTAPDGVVLRGWFARPAEDNGDAVILLHGIGDNRDGMTGFAELFLSKGYEVLLPDLRAHGASGGDYPTYGVKEADDVERWYHWLTVQRHPACVFGMGESMGAAIILQATRTTPFCGVVAESPFASFRQIAYVRVGQMFHVGSWLGKVVLRPAVELAFEYAEITRHVDLSQVSPENCVARSKIPILLIHGLADDNIPAEQSKVIRSRNPADVVLWEVPRAGHCGAVSVAGEEFDSRVLNWFSAHNASVHRSALN